MVVKTWKKETLSELCTHQSKKINVVLLLAHTQNPYQGLIIIVPSSISSPWFFWPIQGQSGKSRKQLRANDFFNVCWLFSSGQIQIIWTIVILCGQRSFAARSVRTYQGEPPRKSDFNAPRVVNIDKTDTIVSYLSQIFAVNYSFVFVLVLNSNLCPAWEIEAYWKKTVTCLIIWHKKYLQTPSIGLSQISVLVSGISCALAPRSIFPRSCQFPKIDLVKSYHSYTHLTIVWGQSDYFASNYGQVSKQFMFSTKLNDMNCDAMSLRLIEIFLVWFDLIRLLQFQDLVHAYLSI